MRRLRYYNYIRKHQQALYNTACYMLSSPAEAEEVVQESLLKFWDQFDQVVKKNPGAWLMTVTRNRCIDLLRKRKQSWEYAAAVGAETQDSHVNTPWHELNNESLHNALREAIGKLDEPQRSLVILREIQGMDYKDCADALELSLSQVKVYLYRARQKLRKLLAGTYEQERTS